jgi:hypothetical protein
MKSDEGEPVWLEEWDAGERTLTDGMGGCTILATDGTTPRNIAIARLAAAAPAMVRALLRVEWADERRGLDGCPGCDTVAPDRGDGTGEHDPSCPLDAALTQAGFPDQPSRDAARERMGR